MSGFLAGAALLVIVTLLFLLVPLLRRPADSPETTRTAINAAIYRDQMGELDGDLAAGNLSQADFDEGRRELQRRLLDDAGADAKSVSAARRAGLSALLVGLTLPIAAALLYFTLGNLPALSPESAPSPKISAQQIEDMVAKLAARMEQQPDDLQGWVMLARSYKAMGRFEESIQAFAKAEPVVDADPHLLAEYAEALAFATGGSLKGRPDALIARALKLDPNHPEALILAGTAAYERENFSAAAAFWERLLKQLPPDSEDAQMLSESIKKARDEAKKTK
ncbi:MAG: c-type cytochrome biogenesis protein CcmI [Sulfuritalea sp.]|nr:c-type cytochrome biogenesis protein CcmI [Sulfuritalea sp.]